MICAIMMLLAMVHFNRTFKMTLVKASIAITISSIKTIRKLQSTYTNLGKYREVAYDLFRGGMSWGFVYNFFMFKIQSCVVQHFENGLVVKKKHYEITYNDGDRKYQIRFPKHRGVRQIIRVETTEEPKDITDDILKLLGPSHNFHGIPTTPELLGYDSLKIYYRNDTHKIILKNSVIPTHF